MATRSVAEKMGVKPGWTAHFVNAPDGVPESMELPDLRMVPLRGEIDYLLRSRPVRLDGEDLRTNVHVHAADADPRQSRRQFVEPRRVTYGDAELRRRVTGAGIVMRRGRFHVRVHPERDRRHHARGRRQS